MTLDRRWRREAPRTVMNLNMTKHQRYGTLQYEQSLKRIYPKKNILILADFSLVSPPAQVVVDRSWERADRYSSALLSGGSMMRDIFDWPVCIGWQSEPKRLKTSWSFRRSRWIKV